MTPDQQLARLAARQHGLVTTHHALACGLSPANVHRRVVTGRLERLAPEVYRVAGAPETWHQRVLVACFTERAAASHRTAAALHDLDGFAPRVIEVVTERWSRRPRPGSRVHESLDLAAADLTTRRSIPVTSVVRTIIDLGAVVPGNKVEQAFDDALRRGLTTPDEVADRFVRLARRGRRGVGVLRPHLEHRLGTAGPRPGEFERRMWRLLVDAGIDEPVCEHEVRSLSGLFVARVDLAYPSLRIAIECDSERWHSGRQRRHADLDRQNALVLAGWTVLRFTWDHLVLQPDSIVDRVRQALAVPAGGVPA